MFRKSFKSGLTGLNWLLNVLIGIFGWSKYSHVELVLPGNLWISSTMKQGVRMTVERKEGEWEKVSFDITDKQMSLLVDMIYERLNKKYDYLAVFRHIGLPFQNDKDKYYCSELVAELLLAVNILEESNLSVKGLYRRLVNNDY